MISEIIATAIMFALAGYGAVAASRKRQHELEPSSTPLLPPTGRYEIRPFPPYGDLFTFEEFQELLKHWHMTDGRSRWASADGEWFDTLSNQYVRANPHEIREGKRPEIFFSHIKFYGK